MEAWRGSRFATVLVLGMLVLRGVGFGDVGFVWYWFAWYWFCMVLVLHGVGFLWWWLIEGKERRYSVHARL